MSSRSSAKLDPDSVQPSPATVDAGYESSDGDDDYDADDNESGLEQLADAALAPADDEKPVQPAKRGRNSGEPEGGDKQKRGRKRRRKERDLTPIDKKKQPKKWSNVMTQRTKTILGKMNTLGAQCRIASVWITLETGTNNHRVFTPLEGNPDPDLADWANQPHIRKDLTNWVNAVNSPALTRLLPASKGESAISVPNSIILFVAGGRRKHPSGLDVHERRQQYNGLLNGIAPKVFVCPSLRCASILLICCAAWGTGMDLQERRDSSSWLSTASVG